MRDLLLVLIFALASSTALADDNLVGRGIRMSCERQLFSEKHKLTSVLAKVFDYSEEAKRVDIEPLLTEDAWAVFNLVRGMEIKDIRFSTRWLKGSLKPEVEFYLDEGTRRVSLTKFEFDPDKVSRFSADEIGLLDEDSRYRHFHRFFVSVRTEPGLGAFFVFGLDVNCDRVGMYLANPKNSTRILTEHGVLCRIPMLYSEARMSFLGHKTRGY